MLTVRTNVHTAIGLMNMNLRLRRVPVSVVDLGESAVFGLMVAGLVGRNDYINLVRLILDLVSVIAVPVPAIVVLTPCSPCMTFLYLINWLILVVLNCVIVLGLKLVNVLWNVVCPCSMIL